jgi:glycosylphosphatidylinositol deacylase
MNDTSSLGISTSSTKEKHINNNTEIDQQTQTQQPVPHLRIDRADEQSLPLLTNKSSNSRMSSPDSSPSPPSSPTMSRAILPRLYRLVNFSRFLIFILIFFSIGSIFVMLDSFQHHQRDVSGCQTSYMRPEYIKQTGFDSEMTRFAGKYGLYLYREKGVDFTDQVKIYTANLHKKKKQY